MDMHFPMFCSSATLILTETEWHFLFVYAVLNNRTEMELNVFNEKGEHELRSDMKRIA